MNTALIFAGGSGTRMNSAAKPKQFLEVNGKPIIIHTIEYFENNKNIDAICVVCIDGWINYLEKLLDKFSIAKVVKIVKGGSDGQSSIFNGLNALNELYGDMDDTIVLIHDGVRPLINDEIITANIETVKEFNTCITVAPAIETIATVDENQNVLSTVNRSQCRLARAPQSFYLKDIFAKHLESNKINKHDFIDSASMMMYYKVPLHTVDGPIENIKITTPSDYYIFRAILEARENMQIIGL